MKCGSSFETYAKTLSRNGSMEEGYCASRNLGYCSKEWRLLHNVTTMLTLRTGSNIRVLEQKLESGLVNPNLSTYSQACNDRPASISPVRVPFIVKFRPEYGFATAPRHFSPTSSYNNNNNNYQPNQTYPIHLCVPETQPSKPPIPPSSQPPR